MLLPCDKQELLADELDADEKLLWSGQPDPVRMARPAIALFTLGVFWSGMTFFGVASSWRYISVDLFMIPFVLLGLALLAAPGWAYFQATKMVYGITTDRVLIVKGGKARQVESYGRTDLGTFKRLEYADRSGTLTFAQKFYKDSDGDKQTKEIQFIGIPEVREVEALLRQALTVGG